MSDAEEGSPEFEMHGKGGGVILGYWDHEKTPALIQDLERSVALIEGKCKQLLEELIYYKRCGEEYRELDHRLVRFEGAILHLWDVSVVRCTGGLKVEGGTFLSDKEVKVSRIHHSTAVVHGSRQWCHSKSDITKSCSLYGSEPDIVHRQNLINFRELQQVFEERFEQKLYGINKELTEVSRKIGLKNNVVLFPTKDYLKALNAQIEKEAQKSWCNNRDKFFKNYLFNGSTKSDSGVHPKGGGEGEFSKITKNELALYQKLTSMNKRKRRGKKGRGKAAASKGEKIKLSGRWKILKLRQDLMPSKRKKRKSGKRTCKKREKRITILQTASSSPRNSHSTLLSLGKLSDSEIEKICKLLSESIGKKRLLKSCKSRQETREGASVETKRSTTFTSCSAPLRSSEVSMGQLHQMKALKSNLRISASENIHGGTKKRDIFSRSTTPVNKGHPILRSSSDIKNDMSKRRKNGHAKLKRKVWTEKHSPQNVKKPQLKCTISLPRGFFEDTTSLSNFKSESAKKTQLRDLAPRGANTINTINSKENLSGCQTSNVWDVCKEKHNFADASGDGSRNNLSAKKPHKWTKGQSSFLNTKRKNNSLKTALRKRNLAFVDKELQCLEKEIVCSLDKYKKFLQFYSSFLHKNHRIKPSKIDRETTNFRPEKRRISWDLNPVYVNAMKKAFKEVEALQKKIKLWTVE